MAIFLIEVISVQDVVKLELLCKQLHEATNGVQRQEAEKALVEFQSGAGGSDTLARCQMLLDRAHSSYSQYLATTTLTKMVSRNPCTLTLQQRIHIRQYFPFTSNLSELNQWFSTFLLVCTSKTISHKLHITQNLFCGQNNLYKFWLTFFQKKFVNILFNNLYPKFSRTFGIFSCTPSLGTPELKDHWI